MTKAEAYFYEARDYIPFDYTNDRECMTLDGGSGGLIKSLPVGEAICLCTTGPPAKPGACFSELILIRYPQDLVEGLVCSLVLTLLTLLVQGLGRAAVLTILQLGHSGIGGCVRLVAQWR